MIDLARRGVKPTVVADQFGRLTFTADLADGIAHLLSTQAPYGTYNLTSAGPIRSWFEIASDVFTLVGRSERDVSPISTDEYAPGKLTAPRPRHSTLSLDKITAAGFAPQPANARLAAHVGDALTVADEPQ